MVYNNPDKEVKKEIENLIEVIEKNSKATKRSTSVAIFISVLAVIFTSIGVFYSIKDDLNDLEWMKIQTEKFDSLINCQNNNSIIIIERLDTIIGTSQKKIPTKPSTLPYDSCRVLNNK